MNKKIIAVLLLATVLFTCVFASCKKNEDPIYAGDDEIDYVTDENGEKVLDYEGRLIVYQTDEDGKRVTDANGEYVTIAQEFQPIIEDGVVEDLGFKYTLPEGWKTTEKFGTFVSEDGTQTVDIAIEKETYDDYYARNKALYDSAKEVYGEDVVWHEGVELGEGFQRVCRFTMKSEDGTIVMYFFINSTNLYKVRYLTSNSETAIEDSENFIKLMDFKPYAYYNDITSRSTTEETTEKTTAKTKAE